MNDMLIGAALGALSCVAFWAIYRIGFSDGYRKGWNEHLALTSEANKSLLP